MKNRSMLMFIGILVTLIIVACVTPSLADTVIIGGGNTNVANTSANTANTTNIINNTVTNTANTVANIAGTTANIAKTNTSATTNTLPQTGVTDGYVVAVLVVVCGISAIYAYRKIRDYNIK